MIRMAFLIFLLCASCASAPFSTEQQKQVDVVSAASFLGDELVMDLSSQAISMGRGKGLDISPWKLDETVENDFRAGALERGKEFRALPLDLAEVKRTLNARENRWKKTVGKYSQALLDILFRESDRQGVRYLFLIYPLEGVERFPLYSGPVGIHCDSSTKRVSVYFEADFSLWDVHERKKLFQGTVGPGTTENVSFADCYVASALPEPVKQLEGPVKKTAELLVAELFKKMDWPAGKP